LSRLSQKSKPEIFCIQLTGAKKTKLQIFSCQLVHQMLLKHTITGGTKQSSHYAVAIEFHATSSRQVDEVKSETLK